MRNLTDNERRLIFVFFGAIFIMANLLLFYFVRNYWTGLQETRRGLEQQKELQSMMLNFRSQMEPLAEWLNENQPAYETTGDAQTQVVEMLQQSTQQFQLESTPPIVDEIESYPTHYVSSATVQVTGDIKPMLGWLVQIQKDNQFNAITDFTLRTETEPSDENKEPPVVADLRVERYFRLTQPGEAPLNNAASGETGGPASTSSLSPDPGAAESGSTSPSPGGSAAPARGVPPPVGSRPLPATPGAPAADNDGGRTSRETENEEAQPDLTPPARDGASGTLPSRAPASPSEEGAPAQPVAPKSDNDELQEIKPLTPTDDSTPAPTGPSNSRSRTVESMG